MIMQSELPMMKLITPLQTMVDSIILVIISHFLKGCTTTVVERSWNSKV